MHLALLMIVRNEEVALPHLLESVRPFISSWVIHDTGSTDRTPQIVEEMLAGIPGRFEHRPWRDFGSNRTELIRQFPDTADYALLLDADHILRVHDHDWLAAGDRGEWPDADCLLVSITGDTIRYRMPYLVRRRDDFRYQGRTHEILVAGADLVNAEYDGISVEHTALGGSKQDKTERDLELLAADLAENPDSRAHFFMAQTLSVAGRLPEAVKHYELAESFPSSPEAKYYCALSRGRLLMRMGQFPESLTAFDSARRAYSGRVEAHLDAARVLAHLGQFSLALPLLREAKAQGAQRGVMFLEDWVTDWGLDLELATAEWWAGDKERAREMFRQMAGRSDLPEAIQQRVQANLAF